MAVRIGATSTDRGRLLPWVRTAFCGLYLACLATLVPQALTAGGPDLAPADALAATPLVSLAVRALVLRRRGRPEIVGDVLDAAAITLLAAVLGDPGRGSAALFTAVQFRALYGDRFSRALGSTSLMLGGFLLGDLSEGFVGIGLTAVRVAPAAVAVSLTLHLLAAAVQRHEEGSEARLAALVSAGPDVIAVVDAAGRVDYASPAAERLAAATSASLLDWLDPLDRARAADVLRGVGGRPGGEARLDCRLVPREGAPVEAELTLRNYAGDPAIRGLVVSLHDVSERNRLARQLRERAETDSLTGLANRALIERRLRDGATARAGALLFLDLDDFKVVNDTRGHEVGDLLLTAAAERLRETVGTTGLVARIGGDEFAVLLGVDDDAPAEAAERLARALCDAFAAPIVVAGRGHAVGLSVGVAVGGRGDGADVGRDLLRDADIAMYRAKQRRGRTFEVFEPTMRMEVVRRARLEQELEAGIETGQLRLRFQPIVATADGTLLGAESLVRWQHPCHGLLGPGEFVALAEASGLISSLGRWVLSAACREAAGWTAAAGPLRVSVNVAAHQLRDEDFAGHVRAALADSGLSADRLVLEITESAIMGPDRRVAVALDEIRRLGVRFALDDFGTGYSSLSRLHTLPVDFLKIDKSFVDLLRTEPRPGRQLVEAVIRLAAGLGLTTIAEGVEEERQRRALAALDCAGAQGFLFAPPLEPGSFRDLCRGRGAGGMAA